MRTNALLRSLAALALCTGAAGAFAQVAVVVNPKSPVAAMTADQVSGIFLGKVNTLPSGATALPADLPDTQPAHDLFYAKVTGKSNAQVKAAWSRLVFSGKATPPKELASSADVKRFVAANPDAIGYIDKSTVDASVKVVFGAE
jgi:ABC-type phosphate transport system substrate-binding protein